VRENAGGLIQYGSIHLLADLDALVWPVPAGMVAGAPWGVTVLASMRPQEPMMAESREGSALRN
jgi:hypothetical protein